MPLKDIIVRPGVNRENTRYATQLLGKNNSSGYLTGWYETQLVRFRQGTPEKMGGWAPISTNTFLGICRSLWAWVSLSLSNYIGVGTNLKFYIYSNGVYNDITPTRTVNTLTNPFLTTASSPYVLVTDATTGYNNNDFVTFSGASAVGGLTLNNIYQINKNVSFNVTGTLTASSTAVTLSASNTQIAVGFNITGNGISSGTSVAAISGTSLTLSTATTSGAGGLQTLYFTNPANTYFITASSNATSNATGGGTVTATYQINTGSIVSVAATGGWGSGPWGGTASTGYSATGWGVGTTGVLRLWAQSNYGQDLVFCTVGGAIYYWFASGSVPLTTPAVSLSSVPNITIVNAVTTSGSNTITFTYTSAYSGLAVGEVVTGVGIPFGTTIASYTSGTGTLTLTKNAIASGTVNLSVGALDCPLTANWLIVSDASRFLIVFGTNDTASTTYNPLLVRWSDQESITTWTPSPTNQAGSYTLSHGTTIITALQMNQQILVYTDSSLYAMQYVGTPAVWGFTLVGANQSIASPNAVAYANGTAYWMGHGKFYMYDGVMKTLSCDLRKYIFDNINTSQYNQVCSGTNEQFNEVWWFYTSNNSTNTLNDSYVVYNYLEDIWYFGSLSRTAWLENGLYQYPFAATGANYTLVYHEFNNDNNETGVVNPIDSYITSSEFNIQDGSGTVSFVWRVLPDFTFLGTTTTGQSANANPQVTMSFYPMLNAGSGVYSPQSVGGNSSGNVMQTVSPTYSYTVEQFTGQINTRLRGRNIYFKIEGNQLGLAWQAGIPRFDMQSDGRR